MEEYLESWSAELRARAHRVRQLIGGRHWLSDGIHKEWLLSESLLRFLPDGLTIQKGFVKGLPIEDSISREIDLLIYDAAKHFPWFKSDDLVIAHPRSVHAIIQSKSQMSLETLTDAIAANFSAHRVMGGEFEKLPVFNGIFFFDMRSEGLDLSDLSKVIECAKKAIQGVPKIYRAAYPDLIVTLNGLLIYVDKSGEDVRLKAFIGGDRAAGIFLYSVLLAVQSQYSSIETSDLMQTIINLKLPSKIGMVKEK